MAAHRLVRVGSVKCVSPLGLCLRGSDLFFAKVPGAYSLQVAQGFLIVVACFNTRRPQGPSVPWQASPELGFLEDVLPLPWPCFGLLGRGFALLCLALLRHALHCVALACFAFRCIAVLCFALL